MMPMHAGRNARHLCRPGRVSGRIGLRHPRLAHRQARSGSHSRTRLRRSFRSRIRGFSQYPGHGASRRHQRWVHFMLVNDSISTSKWVYSLYWVSGMATDSYSPILRLMRLRLHNLCYMIFGRCWVHRGEQVPGHRVLLPARLRGRVLQHADILHPGIGLQGQLGGRLRHL